MNHAFGEGLVLDEAEALIEDLASGETSLKIEVIPTAELEADGAFGEGTIYLSQKYLDKNVDNPEAVSSVLLEEMGHYVDRELNLFDAPGDEGDIFAQLVRGDTISEAELNDLQAEDDSATISIDGEETAVELASASKDEYLIGDWNGDGTDNIAVREGNKILMDTDGDGTSNIEQLYGQGTSQSPEPTPDTDYTELVPIPLDSEMNQGLTSPSSEVMYELIGNPGNPETKEVSPELKELLVRRDVGPFEVYGLTPAVDALERIFTQVEEDNPELYEQLGYSGMYNLGSPYKTVEVEN